MDSGNDLIFISIASYRDAQLLPTIEDLIAKADEPLLLRFGICWQHGDESSALRYATDPRFQILDIDWRESRGACWARAEIMKLWSGEEWYLQVDSHCRFAQGWDTKLIVMAEKTGSAKPILSTYANAFIPSDPDSNTPELLTGPPQLMALETFTEDGIPTLKPLTIHDWQARKSPMRARFLSAGFLFAPGTIVRDVPYDPDLYFFGEEISMTLRAYTSGYDLFHPVESIVWHDYVRSYATRHWDDHTPSTQTQAATPTPQPQVWGDLDRHSRDKVTRLLTSSSENESPEPFGLGIIRTRADFEAYAGLSFRLRKSQDYTRRALEPPNPIEASDWPDRIYTWLIRIVVDTAHFTPESLQGPGFWVVAIQDEDHHEIRRRDFTRAELDTLPIIDSQITLICEIQSGIIPTSWTLWPVNREAGWQTKIEGTLAEEDFAIIKDDEHENATPTEPSSPSHRN